jgi:hypothetical protein
LGDPQRKTEIQDALSEVLGVNCRLRLVLASQFTPRNATPSTPVVNPAPAASGADQASGPPAADEEVPEMISRWAAERGAEVSIVQE